MAVAMDRSISEAPSSTDEGCSCHTAYAHGKGKGACPCKKAGVSCTVHCSCGEMKTCKNNKPISEEPITTANSESDEVREVTKGMAALTTREVPGSTHDRCSCKPTSTCARTAGIGPCPCRVAGRLCTNHCSCDVKKPCSNKGNTNEATTGSTDLAETSTTDLTTTSGGCSFDALINREKNYCCDPSYLIDLEKEVPTTDEKGTKLDKEVIKNRRVAKLVGHVDGIFRELKIRDKIVKNFFIGKTNVVTWSGRVFDNMNPNTWRRSDGIGARWRDKYKDMGYNGLIVITVVTRSLLPLERGPQKEYQDQEEYALMLERELIYYYKEVRKDPRIMNEGYNTGKKAKGKIGYPLYVAFKF